jgi:hypothetical protein
VAVDWLLSGRIHVYSEKDDGSDKCLPNFPVSAGPGLQWRSPLEGQEGKFIYYINIPHIMLNFSDDYDEITRLHATLIVFL